ncbi:Cof-type HAD-IIB family hydrolase [Christensenellaceae bacterium OttesenSCG-928-L17]|nr:Cof-type HAD-IIB family hydrolase [Christensenellaceae bacterium OttesenSCG-928-L17]
MLPFEKISSADAQKIRYILCDIDDTITTDGKLTAEAYTALWRLHDAGYGVVPVTGRPAGWCDLIVRQWPVLAVVGENGAFVSYMKEQHLYTCTHRNIDAHAQERLQAVRDAVLKAVPGCRVSKDQFSRRFDLAIDFREDPPYLSFEDAERIRAVCEQMGAEAKVSSIHVNAWFGKYDKLSMTEQFFREILKEEHFKERVLFFGDSPNDEPMFAYFPQSCAVANIRPFVEKIKNLPKYVTSHEGGAGFAEAVDHLLSLRESQ